MKEIFKISGVTLKKKYECVILGACINEFNVFNKISYIVTRQDFSASNIEVYDALFYLFENNIPIDLINVSKQILIQINATKKTEIDSYARINQYLISLSEMVCSTANLECHAKTLSQLSLQETLIKQLEKLINNRSLPNDMQKDFILFRQKLEYIECDPIDLLNKSNQFFKLKYPNQSYLYQKFIDIEIEYEDRIIEINSQPTYTNLENNKVCFIPVNKVSNSNFSNELPF